MIIRDLYNPVIGTSHYTGFINAVDNIKPITGEWIDNIDKVQLDNIIYIKCGKRRVYSEFDTVESATYEKISDILSSYSYELDGLYNSMLFDYNPIENYDRTEVQSATNNITYGNQSSSTEYGAQKITNEYDEVTQTNNIDAVKQTDTVGARTQTSQNGARSTSDTLGAENRTVTNTITTSAFDDTDYNTKKDKNITNDDLNSRTNTHSENASTDTVNTASATDTSGIDARTDTSTIDARTDTVNTDTHTDTVSTDSHTDTGTSGYNLSVKGNIGVMSTQQMISQERDIVMFNFFDYVVDIIYSEITTMIYEV